MLLGKKQLLHLKLQPKLQYSLRKCGDNSFPSSINMNLENMFLEDLLLYEQIHTVEQYSLRKCGVFSSLISVSMHFEIFLF